MAKAPQQSVSLPTEMREKLEALRVAFSEHGLELSFSETVVYVLRRADRAGLLSTPRMADSTDRAIASLEVATDRAKSALAQKPKK